MGDLGVLAAVVLGYALVSRVLRRHAVTAPMVFVAAGILAGPSVLDVVGADITDGSGLVLAEFALAMVLFSDSARIDLAVFKSRRSLPTRLLGIGMPLTIGLGVAAGALLLAEIEFWEAAIIAAVLAPTDAALGQVVISDERVPERVRNGLNVESGLNDGLSVPFLALFVALAVNEADTSATHWVGFAAEQIGYGALVGLALGGAGGWLVEHATRRGWMTGGFQQLSVLALAVLTFVVADEIGGNGFIAAFVGGLAAGRIGATCGEKLFDFLDDEGQLFSLAVFFIFGVAALELLDDVSWQIVAYAALSLTVIRMLPVAVALAGSGQQARSVAFIGWFGPRGLASIVLALSVAEEEPDLPALGVVLAAMTLTVLASVVLHGVSARGLTGAYARGLEEGPNPGAGDPSPQSLR